MNDDNIRIIDGKEIIFRDSQLTRIKADISKFVAETLGKESYSKRNELTGAGGEKLMPVDEKTKEKIDLALDEYLKGHNN